MDNQGISMKESKRRERQSGEARSVFPICCVWIRFNGFLDVASAGLPLLRHVTTVCCLPSQIITVNFLELPFHTMLKVETNYAVDLIVSSMLNNGKRTVTFLSFSQMEKRTCCCFVLGIKCATIRITSDCLDIFKVH